MKDLRRFCLLVAVMTSLFLNVLLFLFYIPELKKTDHELYQMHLEQFRTSHFLWSLVEKEALKAMHQPGWQCQQDLVPLEMPENIPLKVEMACQEALADRPGAFQIWLHLENKQYGLDMGLSTLLTKS